MHNPFMYFWFWEAFRGLLKNDLEKATQVKEVHHVNA